MNNKSKILNRDGFTIMEILVATTVFVVSAVAVFALFNYVLKINRKAEALRQASQGIRDFMEFIAKEVRNGQIDYFVSNGTTYMPAINSNLTNSDSVPCAPPGSGAVASGDTATYPYPQENKLAVINFDNVPECFYLAYGPGGAGALNSYVGEQIFSANTNSSSGNYNPNPNLAVIKNGTPKAFAINPPNMHIDNLSFIIRPTKDPYSYALGLAKQQPFVTIMIKATILLGTGEKIPVIYQTTISSNKYDIPNQ